MGILSNITGDIIDHSFQSLNRYLSLKAQEGRNNKAIQLLFDALAGQQGQNQGGILPLFQMLSSQQSGQTGIMPTDPGNSNDNSRRPYIDPLTGETYYPLMGPGGLWKTSSGRLVRP